MSLPIAVHAITDPARAREVLAGPLTFGRAFADLMLRVEHDRDRGWYDPVIEAFGPLSISPAAKVLHYGLEVFEGHKAYRWPDGRVALFRPELNFKRLNISARRVSLPELPESLQLPATEALVRAIRVWVPTSPGASLYLRPTMIATDPSVGLNASFSHLYFVIASPVGPYFPDGFAPVAVKIEEEQVRATPGGVGFAKTGANYAASLTATLAAKKEGFAQVLWLDALEHRYLEEMTGANVFVIFDGDTLATPPLEGTILPGITRRSVLELAQDMGLKTEERRISVDELVEGIRDGRVTELFATGTAAVITPIGAIGWRGERLLVSNNESGALTRRLHDALTDIQFGRTPDRFGWMRVVEDDAAG